MVVLVHQHRRRAIVLGHNKFSCLSNTAVVVIFLNLCKDRNIYVQKHKIHFVREVSPSTFPFLYHESQKILTIIGRC